VLGRLWVSAPGTVSPLHYDLTDSYLCQVRGVKRLLLWPAPSLRHLQPYPPDHALARRLRVDITGAAPPASLRGPLRARARRAVRAPIEAVLQPGDVLYVRAFL
jgi:ribosomal protein L16 Arg81 hydroxylase